MKADYGVPFDDIHGMIAPAWYERPEMYVGIACIALVVIGVGFLWRWYTRRPRARSRQAVQPVRTPDYWKDRLQEAHTCDEQAYIYADWIRYLKYVAQQCYTHNNMAMTDTEFVAWGWNSLSHTYARYIDTIVQHAEHVRFQKGVVDIATLENDYMFVNEVASYMQSRET